MGAFFPRPEWAVIKNASSKKQQNAADRQQREHAERMAAGVRYWMADPNSRYALRAVFVQADVDEPLPNTTPDLYIAEGTRRLGLAVMAMLRSYAPGSLELLMREHDEDARRVGMDTRRAQQQEDATDS